MPAREQLGELLLELRQPAAAFQEFGASLRTAPHRFNGLYGAAPAARLADNPDAGDFTAEEAAARRLRYAGEPRPLPAPL